MSREVEMACPRCEKGKLVSKTEYSARSVITAAIAVYVFFFFSKLLGLLLFSGGALILENRRYWYCSGEEHCGYLMVEER